MKLCIAVLTHPSHTMLRSTIRSTWWHEVPRNPLKVFLIGHSVAPLVQAENRTFGDMFATAEDDSFIHADLKIFSFVRYARRFAPDMYVFIDDDSYPRFNMILPDLADHPMKRVTAYGGIEYFNFRKETGRFSGWGVNRRHGAAVRPANFSGPFPFLKGPLMLYGSSIMESLVDDPCVRDIMTGVHRFRHRIILDGLIGYLIWRCHIQKKTIKWTQIGVVRSHKNSRQFTGFAEIRWGRNLSAPTSCLKNIHLGSIRRSRMLKASKRGDVLFEAHEPRMASAEEVYRMAAHILHMNTHCR
jgi:hypothetical protein